MSRTIRSLYIVIGLALILTAVASVYLTQDSQKSDKEAAANAPSALVFTQGLPAGHVITTNDVRWMRLNGKAPPESAVLDTRQSELDIIGSSLKRAVTAGEAVREDLLAAKLSGAALATKLNPGFRAVTIDMDAAQLASGRVLPNDRVDLILTPGAPQGAGPIPMPTLPGTTPTMTGVTRILDNVRILAISGATEPADPEKAEMDSSLLKGATVTLELRPDQAERVLASLALGKIALLLRRPNDVDGPTAIPTVTQNRAALRGLPRPPVTTPPANVANPLPVLPAGVAASPAAEPSVLIVRGSN